MRRAALLGLVAGLALGGCGSSSSGDHPKPSKTAKAAPSAAQSFPAVGGRGMKALAQGIPTGPNLALTGQDYKPGLNRVAFGLIDSNGAAMPAATAAVYIGDNHGQNVRGPFEAKTQSLAVDPKFQSTTVKNDPAAPKSFYVVHMPIKRPGTYALLGLVRLDGRILSTGFQGLTVVPKKLGPPDPGEKAIRTHTPTAASVHGDLAKIDTRRPFDTMHSVDLVDALGKKPVVLMFATPQLCRSRTCGPVVDIAEQLKATYGQQVDFIHMEIYNDNDPNKGFRPQVKAWGIPDEPFTFVIDRSGRISSRIEGAFSADELRAAIEKVVKH